MKLYLNLKILIAIISGMIWIYFRNYENYRALPNNSLISTLLVGFWIWLNYQDPLFLPLGLILLYLYSQYFKHSFSL